MQRNRFHKCQAFIEGAALGELNQRQHQIQVPPRHQPPIVGGGLPGPLATWPGATIRIAQHRVNPRLQRRDLGILQQVGDPAGKLPGTRCCSA